MSDRDLMLFKEKQDKINLENELETAEIEQQNSLNNLGNKRKELEALKELLIAQNELQKDALRSQILATEDTEIRKQLEKRLKDLEEFRFEETESFKKANKEYLDEQDENVPFVELEIVRHELIWLDTTLSPSGKNDSEDNRSISELSFYAAYPYIMMQAYPKRMMVIVDPNKLASITDGDIIDFKHSSEYDTLKLFIREYSSLLLNVTENANVIGLKHSVVVDNTMEKLYALQIMAQEIQDTLIHERIIQNEQSKLIFEHTHPAPLPNPIDKIPNTKILIIAPGLLSIPPDGYGAVEIIIWNYFKNLLLVYLNL